MSVSFPTAVTGGPVEPETVSTRRVEPTSSSPMNEVPHDCLALIFTFLDPTTLLRTAPLVSRRFLTAWRSPVTFSFITAEIHAPQLLRKAGVSISDFAPPICPIVAAKTAAKVRSKQQQKETRRALRNAERERRREQKQRFRKAIDGKESSVSARRHADASSVHDVATAAISSGESRCPVFSRAAAASGGSAVSSGDVVAIGRAMMEHPQCPADAHRGAPGGAVVSREVSHPASCPFSAEDSAAFNASRRNYCPLPPPSPTSRMPTQGAADGPCSNDSLSSAPPGGSFATSCAISFDTVKRPSNPDKFRTAAPASASTSVPAATKAMAGKNPSTMIPSVSLTADEARAAVVHQDPSASSVGIMQKHNENAAAKNEPVVALPLQPLYPPRLHPVETHDGGEDHYDSFDDESMPSPGFPPSAPAAVVSPAIPSATMNTNAHSSAGHVESTAPASLIVDGKTSAPTAKKNTCTKPCCVNPRVLYVLVMRDFKMWPSRFCLPQLLRSVGTYRQVVSAIPEVARGLGRPYPLHKLPQDLTSPTLRALALCCGWWPTHAESETGGETTSVDATSQGSDDSSFSEAQDGTTLVRSQRRARNAALRARRLARLAARNEQHQSRQQSSASSADRHRAFFESETDDDDDSSMLTDSDSDYSSAPPISNNNSGGRSDHTRPSQQEASDGECHPSCADQACPLRSSRDAAADDDDDDEAELSCSSECSCATCSCDMDEEDEQSAAIGEGSCRIKTVQVCDPLTCGQQSVTVAEPVNKPPGDASQRELCCDVAVCSRRVKIIDYYEAKRERTAIRKCRTDDGRRQTAAPTANAAREGNDDDDEDDDDGGLPAGKLAPYRTVYACGTSSDDCCDGDEGSAGRTGRGCGGGCDGYMSDLSDECQVITSTCSAVADVESHALALERYKRRVELGQQSKDEEPPSPPSAIASQSQHPQSNSVPPQAQGDDERDGFVQSSTPHDGEKGSGGEPAGVMSPRRARHCRHQHSHGRAPASPSPPRCSHGSPRHAPSCPMHENGDEKGNENGDGEASSPENSAAADSILTSPVQCHCRSCHHSSPTQSQPHHRHSSSCCHHHMSHHSPRAHRTSLFPSSPTTLAQNDAATTATVESATKQTVEERAIVEEKSKIAEAVSTAPAVSAPAVAAPSEIVQEVTHDDVPAEGGADDAAENHNSESEEANAEDDDDDDEETRDLFFSPFGSHDVYHHIHGAQISIPERDDQAFLRCASFFFTIGLEPDERIRNDPTCNSEVLYCLFPPGVREVYHYHPVVAPVAGVESSLPDESDLSGESGSSVEAPAARRGRESADDVRRAFLGGVFDTDSDDENDSVAAHDDNDNDDLDNAASDGRTDENHARTGRPKHSGSTTPAPASGLSTTCIADLFARRARDVQSGRFTLRSNGLGLDLFPNWGPGTSTVTTNGVTVSLSVLCAMKNVESRLGGAPNLNPNSNQNSTNAGSASSTTSHLFIYRVRIHMGVRQRDGEFDVAASDDENDAVRAAPSVFGDAGAGSDTVSFAPPRALTAAARSVGAGASIINTRGRAGATPPPASSSSTSTPTTEFEPSAQGQEDQDGQSNQDGRDRQGASTEFSRILSVPRAERQYRNVSFISPLRTSSPSEEAGGPPPALPTAGAGTDPSADTPTGRDGDGRQVETATFSPVRTASAGSSRGRATEGHISSSSSRSNRRSQQQRRQRLMEEGVSQCQLVSRHWTIGNQTIRGPGVIGLYPVVRPLDEHAVPPYHEPKQQSLKSTKHSNQTSSLKPATVLSSSSKAVQDSVSRAFDAVFDDANPLGALNANDNAEKSRRDKKVDLLEEARMAMKAGLWHWTRHTEEGDGVFEYCSQTMEPDGTKFGGSLTFVPGTIDHPRGPEFSVEVGEVTLDSSVMAPL